MNFWDEPGQGMQNAALPDCRDVEVEWARLDSVEAAGMAAVCEARLARGDIILAQVPMGRMGQGANTRGRLQEFADRYRISVDTADQYRRVAAWFTPARREAMAQTGGVASYTLLREVALHTHGTTGDAEARFDTLLAALRESASCGSAYLTCSEYLRLLGVPQATEGSTPLAAEQVLAGLKADTPGRAAVLEAVSSDPGVITSVLRTVAEAPDGPAQFFDHLAAEGGLEALQSASFTLRKAKADAKTREEEVFGKEEDPSALEMILRHVLRAMKALEKPLGLDPTQIVEALPPDQFAALNRLCGSVTQWHELLLAAAREADHKKGEVA